MVFVSTNAGGGGDVTSRGKIGWKQISKAPPQMADLGTGAGVGGVKWRQASYLLSVKIDKS